MRRPLRSYFRGREVVCVRSASGFAVRIASARCFDSLGDCVARLVHHSQSVAERDGRCRSWQGGCGSGGVRGRDSVHGGLPYQSEAGGRRCGRDAAAVGVPGARASEVERLRVAGFLAVEAGRLWPAAPHHAGPILSEHAWGHRGSHVEQWCGACQAARACCRHSWLAVTRSKMRGARSWLWPYRRFWAPP